VSFNPLRWEFRAAFTAAFCVSALLLAYAYYTQFYGGLEPCPLCIFQRVAFIAVCLLCLAAALHAPAGCGGRAGWGLAVFVAAMTGTGISIRHIWLQSLPADQVPACGPGLDYLRDAFPLTEWLRLAFTGSGECAKIDWSFLGLSMPGWTLVWFLMFAVGALFFGLRRGPHAARLDPRSDSLR